MLDLLMVVFTIVFFAVALLYVRGCEKSEVRTAMSHTTLIVLILTVVTLIYLVVTLLYPEKF